MEKETLEKLGFKWEGGDVPVASQENVKLAEELQKKEEEIQRLREMIALQKVRENEIRAHRAALKEEINFQNKAIEAQEHVLKLETEGTKLVHRETSRCNQEVKLICKEIEQLQSISKAQNQLYSDYQEKYGALRTGIHIEEEALLEQLQASAQTEDNKMALLKYTQEDDARIKKLNHCIETLEKERREAKDALNEANTEVFISQSKLDSIQKEFRKSFQEREDIIGNWEKVLNLIKARKDEMEKHNKHIADLKKIHEELSEKLEEKQFLLASEQANTKATANQLKERESWLSKLRLLYNEEMKRKSELGANLETIKNVSTSLNVRALTTRSEISQLENQISDKFSKLEETRRLFSDLERDFDRLLQENFDTDRYIRELERLLQVGNSRLAKKQKEFEKLTREVQTTSQDCKKLEDFANSLESEKKSSEAANKSMSKAILKLDSERLQQSTLIYKIKLSLEQMQRRIRSMEGEVSNEEDRMLLEKERNRLRALLKEATDSLASLDQQVKTIMQKLSLAVIVLERSKQRSEELEERTHFLENFATNSLRCYNSLVKKKEKLLVDDCFVSLQLSRYKELLRKKNKAVSNLKANKIEFEDEMKSMLLKLKGTDTMVEAELRRENREISKIRKLAHLCEDKVNKYQIRYDMALKALGLEQATPDAETDLLIKAEEEKRQLVDNRNDLASNLRKQEKDLQALKNTSIMLQMMNDALKKESPSYAQEETIKKLEADERRANIALHKIVEQLYDARDTALGLGQNVEQLESYLSSLEDVYVEKEKLHAKAVAEVESQKTKLSRIDRMNAKLIKELNRTERDIDLEEDIKVHLLKQVLRNQISCLFSAVRDHPILFEETKKRLLEAGIRVPSIELHVRRRSTLQK